MRVRGALTTLPRVGLATKSRLAQPPHTAATPLPSAPPERGPQPERSPVRARWESPDGATNITVLVRRATDVQRTVLQVGAGAAPGLGGDAAVGRRRLFAVGAGAGAQQLGCLLS